MIVWKCFHCDAAIAVVLLDGEVGTTLQCDTVHVIGGTPLYCCRNCGAVQIPADHLLEELEEERAKERARVPAATLPEEAPVPTATALRQPY